MIMMKMPIIMTFDFLLILTMSNGMRVVVVQCNMFITIHEHKNINTHASHIFC